MTIRLAGCRNTECNRLIAPTEYTLRAKRTRLLDNTISCFMAEPWTECQPGVDHVLIASSVSFTSATHSSSWLPSLAARS
jgi:hypothetical protein